MNIIPVQDEQFYALFATDGSFQSMTLSPDFPTCVSLIKLLHKKGMSHSLHELLNVRRYKILPVKVTIVQNGDENKPFKS
jgi:hypothetical protein